MELRMPKNFTTRVLRDFSTKNYASALENFNEAIKLKSTFERAFYNRGTTKIELNDFGGALLDFNTAISLNATAESYFGRAMVYVRMIRIQPVRLKIFQRPLN
jgi:tetratricopeptide (TPR) repeat protein